MMIPLYHKQQLEIVSTLLTILIMGRTLLNICTIYTFHEIVSNLRTICY